MARKGSGGIILVALVLGILCAYLLWSYEKKREERSVRKSVVVANTDIKMHTKITRDMVRFAEYPTDLIPEGAVFKIEDAVDRTTQNPISVKSPIRNSDLIKAGQTPSLSLAVPPGMRAIAIGTSEVQGAGTAVLPGDHIDLIATYADQRIKKEVTRIILQNVLILAVNRGETDPNNKQGAQSSMTLAVRPEQTELVKAAERGGSLNVALRSTRDQQTIQTPGTTTTDLQNVEPESYVPVDTNQNQTPVIFNAVAAPSTRVAKDQEIKIYRGSAVSTEVLSPNNR